MFKRALLLTGLLTSTAAMACTKPTVPTLPDAATAVTAQMVLAKNQINVYVKDSEAYLACIKGNQRKHNRMIDEMQETADNFNAIVRAYRKRMAG